MRLVSCDADTPVRETLEAKAHKVRANAILAMMVRSLKLLSAALREIFDESAYQRFLDRSHLVSSAQSYAIFRQENEQAKSRRPKCC
jgi:hypothetical protein